jgi:hypothetical protein
MANSRTARVIVSGSREEKVQAEPRDEAVQAPSGCTSGTPVEPVKETDLHHTSEHPPHLLHHSAT